MRGAGGERGKEVERGIIVVNAEIGHDGRQEGLVEKIIAGAGEERLFARSGGAASGKWSVELERGAELQAEAGRARTLAGCRGRGAVDWHVLAGQPRVANTRDKGTVVSAENPVR